MSQILIVELDKKNGMFLAKFKISKLGRETLKEIKQARLGFQVVISVVSVFMSDHNLETRRPICLKF